MELTMLGKKELVNVPDDKYKAEVSSIKEVCYEYGPSLIINFKITEGPFSSKEVDGMCTAILSPTSKLGLWSNAMGINIMEGGKFETNNLIGRKCCIMTGTKSISKLGEQPQKVSNVDKVLPPA